MTKIMEFEITESLAESQRKRIINYMREYGSITSLEATHYLNIMSPRKRLSEINEKTPLVKETVYNTTVDSHGHRKTVRYTKYSLCDE